MRGSQQRRLLYLAIAALSLTACTKQMPTPYAPLKEPVDPLALLPEDTQSALRVDIQALSESSVTGGIVNDMLSIEPTNPEQASMLTQLKGAREIVAGVGPSDGGNDSSMLVVLMGDFGAVAGGSGSASGSDSGSGSDSDSASGSDSGSDSGNASDNAACRHPRHTISSALELHAAQVGGNLRILGPCASVKRALDRVDGYAPPSGLESTDQRWREELAYDRSALAFVATAGAYRMNGQGWKMPPDWERTAFAADFSSGVSARLSVVTNSPETAQRTLARFEELRARGMQSIAVRILGVSDILAATNFRRVANTVTARIRFTEQEAKGILQRLELMTKSLKDAFSGAAPAPPQ